MRVGKCRKQSRKRGGEKYPLIWCVVVGGAGKWAAPTLIRKNLFPLFAPYITPHQNRSTIGKNIQCRPEDVKLILVKGALKWVAPTLICVKNVKKDFLSRNIKNANWPTQNALLIYTVKMRMGIRVDKREHSPPHLMHKAHSGIFLLQ